MFYQCAWPDTSLTNRLHHSHPFAGFLEVLTNIANFNMRIIIYLNLISYYASFSFVSIPLKRDNVLLGDTYTAGMDNSQLAGFANTFRAGPAEAYISGRAGYE